MEGSTNRPLATAQEGDATSDAWPPSVAALATPVWIYDLMAHRIRWANPAAVAFWGADGLDDLTRREFSAPMSPSIKRRLEGCAKRLRRGEQLRETWTLFPDGRAVTVACTLTPLPQADGTMAMQVEAHHLDDETILQDRRTAEALRHASSLFILADATGHVASCNSIANLRFPRLLQEREVPVADHLVTDRATRDALKQAMADGRGFVAEISVDCEDGPRWMSLEARRVPDPLTAETATLIFMTDITDRRLLEQERRRHEETLRAVVETAPVPLVVTRAVDGHMIYANSRAGDLFGFSSEDLPGRDIKGYYLVADDRERMIDALVRDGAVDDLRMSLCSALGRPFAASVSARLISYEGEPSILAAILDIEEDTEARRALRQALERQTRVNTLRKQFTSMLGHEFMTPVSVIDGAARRITRLLSKEAPADDILPWADRIQAAAKRITEVVSEIQRMAHADDGALGLETEETDVAALLDKTVERHRRITAKHEIVLAADGLDGPMTLDPKVLDIVLSNLLGNAIKYSPDGGTIQVRADRVDTGVKIAVRDGGMGIPEEEQERIFDRFYRSPRVSGIVGTGQGLDISRRLVEMHGGTLTVESTHGQGSCFTFTLAEPPAHPA